MSFYLLGYLTIFYIAVLRLFTLRRDLALTLFLFAFIGVLGGIRFETGMDWPQYAEYFESISVEQSLLSAYQNNDYKLAFEFGFFLLNYTIKYLGGGLEIVFLIASLFCALSTYLLSSIFPGNRVFIFAMYVSYNFIYMHFSTVRQSIAVGLFFISVWMYLKFSKKVLPCVFFALSAFFQISALLYVFIFFTSFFIRNTFRYIIVWLFAALLLFVMTQLGSNPYKILSLILPTSFSAKLMEYATWTYALSFKTYLFSLYIIFCALNLSWLEMKEKNKIDGLTLTAKDKFSINIATTSLLLSANFIFLFPTNFALWTRTFNVAAVLFACALSIFYRPHSRGYQLLFLAHLAMAAVAFTVSMLAGADAMVPYKTIF